MRQPFRFAIVVLCVGLSGCANGTWSTTPLTTPEQAKLDRRFLGVWQTSDIPTGDDRTCVVHVSSAGEEFPKGMMRVHLVTNPKPPAALGYHDFLAFASIVDDQQYLNVLLPEIVDFKKPDPAKLDKWDSEFKAAYFLLEVQHSDSAIRLRTMDLESLARHITAEEVPGKIRRTSNGQIAVVELRASTNELARFVSEHQDSVFDRSHPGARIVRLSTHE